MSDMGRAEGKIAIVTGGASGIGRACGQRLAEQGAKVRLLDRNAKDGKKAVEAMDQDDVSFMELDVQEEDSWRNAISDVVSEFAYGASKGGVRQFSKSVAHHCARRDYGIRCNSVHPGSIETPMGQYAMRGVAATLEEGRERYRRGIPLKEIGEPDDIAFAVLFLASDESKYVTGQELTVDGGIMMA